VPVAAGGAIWAALVLLLALVGMRSSKADTVAAVSGYIFVLATIGLAAVLYFAYASFFILNRMCVLCMAVYVAAIGIFLLSAASAQVAVGKLPGRIGRDVSTLLRTPTAAALAAAWLIASVSLVAFFPRDEAAGETSVAASPGPTETLQAEEVAQFEAWLAMQPRVELPIPTDGARVVVAKFNDYQCPACRQTFLEYKWIAEKYKTSAPGQVKFVTLDFPLETECNTGGPHGAACEAAVAVRLAREKGRGEAMEDWLFANQSPSMTREEVKEGLQEIAQVGDFDAQYTKALEQVRADAMLGNRLGVNGTPTFFINGIKINSSLRPSYFDAAIAYELKKASGPGPQGSEGTSLRQP
jgi:protein-disulfide isomerase